MDDMEFLGYCEIHCTTPRALFSRAQIDRLLNLAGDRRPIAWDGTYPQWIPLREDVVHPMVESARELLFENFK